MVFAQRMSKNIGKNINKNSSDKHSSGIIAALHQRLDHAKKSGPDALKTGSKRAVKKISKTTCNLISKFDPKQRQQIIDDLALI